MLRMLRACDSPSWTIEDGMKNLQRQQGKEIENDEL